MKPHDLRSLLLVVTAVYALAGVASCKKTKQYPESTDGLVELIRDIRSGTTPSASLKLPDATAWFTEMFGEPTLSEKLTADLEHKMSRDLRGGLEQLADKGKTEIRAERFTDPEDPMACGNESFAIKHAKKPLTLYSVHITPPGAKGGIHIYSFVYLDHAFRFVGPMSLLHPEKPGEDPLLAAVYELRNKEREAYFKTGKLPPEE
jgi:hypothetical protein